jgi:segregation and condensation protein B
VSKDFINMELEKETALIETILFLESEPVQEKNLAAISQLSQEVVVKCLENLKEKLTEPSCGLELVMITGGWTFVPKKDMWAVLRERYGSKSEGRLSRSAMETLSIIAYSQPVTRAEIEAVRGVSADNMIRLLLDRNLIKEVGKKDVPGKPVQFGTTKEFLKFFRLNSISELPKLDEDEAERFELAR